ncbi:helix-turn-helix domain-containing protein [Shewanella surugensis]|uniref:helix-turn-helix domain-containing protein n=1 Tax=Shewanella surugensis TaxID=212020 RepID=UPI0035D63EDF
MEQRAGNTQVGGRLTGADIHRYIQSEFGGNYHPDFIYYLLNHMGFSWITSRSKHPKQSIDAQEAFKQIPN